MKTVTFDETKWALVPLEPTATMLIAAGSGRQAAPAYRAMVDAAPEHDAPSDFALVPTVPTPAMDAIMDEEGWAWEDLLATAQEAVTVEQQARGTQATLDAAPHDDAWLQKHLRLINDLAAASPNDVPTVSRALDALKAHACQCVPAGYRVVPEQPTADMLVAALHSRSGLWVGQATAKLFAPVYRAMLAAAPGSSITASRGR